jgi:hypothetical protein
MNLNSFGFEAYSRVLVAVVRDAGNLSAKHMEKRPCLASTDNLSISHRKGLSIFCLSVTAKATRRDPACLFP